MKTRHIILSIIVFALPCSANAGMRTVFAGTGFYVNRDGYLVTNAHVVQNCQNITVQGAVADSVAELIARDESKDLAILKTGATPPDAAELRSDYFPVTKDERVVTVGFPGGRGPATREATIVDPKGPRGEPQWIQFTDASREGNSGGPLLDSGGKVLGVVMAKSSLYRKNLDSGREDIIRESDIAIANSVVKAFLDGAHVRYRENTSGGLLAAHRLEDRASEFIVIVRCWQ